MSDEEKMKAIIKRLKSRRIELGYSYQELADKTGLSKSTLQRYETGYIKNMPIDKLEDIASALETSPSHLMGWEITNNSNINSAEAKLIGSFNQLNDIGKREATKRVEELTYFPQYTNAFEVNAAHELPNSSLEDKIHDDDIMDDDSEWD